MRACFICGSKEVCEHREDTLRFPLVIHRQPEGDAQNALPSVAAKRPRKVRSIQERARYYLAQAVRRGEIVKPSKCERCGIAPKILQGHHWDYSKPLAVTWLCRMCHGFVDELIKSRRGTPVQIFARMDLERIATLLRTDFQLHGYNQVSMLERLGKLFEFSTGPDTTALKESLDATIQ